MKAEDLIVDALIKSARILPPETMKAIEKAEKEESGIGKVVMDAIMENLRKAGELSIPMCQDTGMLWVWAEVGRNARCNMVALEKLILSSARKAFRKGLFRTSVVNSPMGERTNSGNNMPPVVNYTLSDGDDIVLHFLLKGFGSENCSSVRMLNPTAGEDGVVDAVSDIMEKAGAKPCPPVFLGIGVGGTMDRAAVMSKEAFFSRHRETDIEKRIRDCINEKGSGPGGLGGRNTCIRVYLQEAPTHIAGLPVAVTVNCWAERKTEVVLKGGYDGEDS
ncbi:MAG: fumarate hydratase [Candidatus Ornithospirochaeta sp.]